MKAVIMAGGEGTRLRPLTCDMPKPMAPICGRPMMDYTLELLARHGFDEASVTLMYMPQVIREYFGGEAHGVKLKYFTEDTPLGTAGSVKAAAADFGEDFLVISGDALCDFDLKAIMDFHKAKGCAATIVLKGMPNPLEYGLVVTDQSGRVTRFLEKPDWGQALTDLVNTGVYVLSTECMKLIPDGKAFDFGKELFPLMLSRGMQVYGYVEDGYWLDIGDIGTYISGQFDLIDGKVKFDLSKKGVGNGANIKPNCFIGENVSISKGAHIGEYSVIGDGCRIAEGASIRNSVIGAGSYIGKRAEIRGALICGGCVVKADAQMYDGSVLGSKSVLSEGAVVSPNVRIWPSKHIEANSGVYSDVIKGDSSGGLIENGVIFGTVGADITPEYAARIGAAAATALKGGKIAVAYDGCEGGGVIKSALIAGMRGSGAEVVDMGMLPLNVFSFGVYDRALELGLNVTDIGIAVRDRFGQPPIRELVRKIESAYRIGDFTRGGYREAKSDGSIFSDYCRRLEKYKTRTGTTISVRSSEESFLRLYSYLFPKGGGVRIEFNSEGTEVTLSDESGMKVSKNRLLCGICMLLAELGEKEIALPPESPIALADAVECLGVKPLVRMLCSPDKSDEYARSVAARQRVLDDMVEGCAFLISCLSFKGESVGEFFMRVPKFYISEYSEPCGDWNGGMLIRMLGEQEGANQSAIDGISLKRNNACCTVRPSLRGKALRVVAEAESMEAAEELGAEISERLHEIKLKLDKKMQ